MIVIRLRRLALFLALSSTAVGVCDAASPAPPGAEDAASEANATAVPETAAPLATDATTETTASDPPLASVDPLLVDLPALAPEPVTADEFGRAAEQVGARIAALRDASQASDARIESLRALRVALQRRAALVGQQQEQEQAQSELNSARETFEQQGLAPGPPYSVSFLDELYGDHRVSEQVAQAAKRALSLAQRQVDTAESELTAADQQRRRLRDQLERDGVDADTPQPSDDLQAARLSALAAYHRAAAARTDLALAHERRALARERSALLEAKIERAEAELVFPQTALDQELRALEQREQELQQRIDALAAAADRADSALIELRQGGAGAEDAPTDDMLDARLAAVEAELTAARKGVEYLSEIAAGTDTAATLWKRRYSIIRADAEETGPMAQWLQESADVLAAIDEDGHYMRSELDALRTQQLVLARRLTETGLSPGLREALNRHQAALDEQEALASELLVLQERLGALAERVQQELQPLVDRGSIARRLDQAQALLTAWWNEELFVIQDQGIYLYDIMIASAVFLLVLSAVSFLQMLLRRTLLPRLVDRLARDRRAPQALMLAIIRNTRLSTIVVLAFYAAMAASGIVQGRPQDWLFSLLVVVLWLQVGVWASAVAADLINRNRSLRERRDPSTVTGFGLLQFFARVGIWLLVLVSILSYFDYPVAGLIGALGVGGIAVAFAVQNILADVFSSLAIILDKPFRVGDFIITNNTMGVIEQIGVKTTQVRSLSGEQVIISNTDLLNSRIHNYKRMRERRVVFKLGVVYQTPPETLERIPEIIKDIVRAQSHTRFDRAHFFEYGDFALMFEVVYYVTGADYNLYMDTQQAINLAIYRAFRRAEVEFAYPTQELILRRDAPISQDGR